jgi:hypothetical protein
MKETHILSFKINIFHKNIKAYRVKLTKASERIRIVMLCVYFVKAYSLLSYLYLEIFYSNPYYIYLDFIYPPPFQSLHKCQSVKIRFVRDDRGFM